MAKRRGQGGGKPQPAAESADAPGLDPKDAATEALSRARRAMARGDFRQTSALSRGVLAGSPSEASRAEARRLLADSKPDPAALVTGLVVLAVIALAAWAGLLHHH